MLSYYSEISEQYMYQCTFKTKQLKHQNCHYIRLWIN